EVTPVIDSFKNIFNKELKKYFQGDSLEDLDLLLSNTKTVVKELIQVVYEVMDEYSNLKNNMGVLDFNDLEHKALELLEFSDVREDLVSNYEYVFVDEYQDINEMQESIIAKLVNGTNLNMIGDVKQSIYAFRLSTPKIFIDKYNSFKQDSKANLAIDLNYNYRSDLNILEFVNFICDSVITVDTIGVDYINTARLKTKADKSNKDNPVVRVNIIDTEQNADEEESGDKEAIDTETLDSTESEAHLVLQEINNIISQESLTENGTTRPYKYEDIAILVRSKTNLVKAIIDVLTMHQIPVNVSLNSEFFDTYEVSVLVAILKVIANYKDDISLVTVLKSPLFGLTDEDLVTIRQNCPKEKYYYQAIEGYDKNDSIKNTITSFFDFVSKYNNYLLNHTLYELINAVIVEYDLICYFKSMPDGDIKEINILEFVDLLNNESYKYDIYKFLNYLRFIDKDKYSKSLGDGKGVNIYTIHYSKGLEYPAVIMAGMGSKFNLNKDTNNIVINDVYGVGIKAVTLASRQSSSTMVVDACKLANKKSEIDEEIRLFYVAMTRARNLLSLVGRYKVSNIAKSATSAIYTSKNYFDLFFKALSKLDIDQIENKYFGDKVSF
ncbi:MAG: UvrD-helicase domain-containing protein, partial [Clostridia bacterium]|nr:UvrD-helicase domain-containing protein [Clostridia bacterium]